MLKIFKDKMEMVKEHEHYQFIELMDEMLTSKLGTHKTMSYKSFMVKEI